MSNYNDIVAMLEKYLSDNNIDISIKSDLHKASFNDNENNYLYNGKKLQVVDMDNIAKKAYRLIKKPDSITEDDSVNTADAFLVDKENEWFFIEFKDSPLNSVKDSVLKKAYSNWYMLMDILFEMKENESEYLNFTFENPIKFAKENITYIVVCSLEKNPTTYKQIRRKRIIGEKYTAPFLERIKSYLFKDAYVYTEDFFEREFVNKFEY